MNNIKLTIIPLILLISGCSFSVGSYENGLWFDHDKREYNPNGLGIKADIVAGQMIIPIPKLGGTNPWDDPWFVIRAPIIAPFISVSIGERGGYLGLKSFEVTNSHREKYWWLREEEFPPEGESFVYFTPSAAIRKTRWE